MKQGCLRSKKMETIEDMEAKLNKQKEEHNKLMQKMKIGPGEKDGLYRGTAFIVFDKKIY
jgi:hypothetical protein